MRSGKTIASLISFMITVAEAPASGLLIISAKTLQTAERNLIEPMQDPTLFGPLAKHVHHTRGSSICTILGRTVHIIGAADARAESKLRGLSAYCILLDEAVLLPEDYVAQALARCSVPGARLLMTTNPAGPRNWLRQKYILREHELDLGSWHFTLDDNPFLDPKYVANLKAELKGVWYQRMVLGRWVAAEGAVYDMWDDDKHILRGRIPPMLMLPAVGIDYGTTAAFSAHMLGITASLAGGPRLVLTREYRHDPAVSLAQKTDAEFSADLRQWIGADRPEIIAVDPSAASFKVQLYHDGLSNVVNARNDVLDGIRMVASLLATGRLLVHESCKGFIDEVAGYSWDPGAAERGEDKPLKLDDHSVDSARYSVATSEYLWRNELPQLVAAA